MIVRMSSEQQRRSAPNSRSGSGAGSAMRQLGKDGQASAGDLARRRRAGQTVLVVDDQPAARYAITRMLQSAGFQTAETASGYEAIEMARTAAAVVLDVNLPDVNGVKVCSTLKADAATSALPVLLHSAVYDDELHREAGLASGADAYFVAPLQQDELVAALDRLLSKA